jgi:hypothetical protein
MTVSFERQHRVDDVFEHAGTGERAVLGDMTDEHDRHASMPGFLDEVMSTLAHLHDRPRSRPDVGVDHGLDRVDHYEVRHDCIERRHDVRQHRLGEQPQRRLQRPEALGAAPHLMGSFLGRHVQRPPADAGVPSGGTEQQCGLAGARLASNQRDRPGHQPTAEHPVELGDARRYRRGPCAVDGGDRHGHGGRDCGARQTRTGVGELLGQGVPLTTRGTSSRPLG